MKNIKPLNEKGKPHGLCEWYNNNGSRTYKGFYNNGKYVGYSEWYWDWDNELSNKTYYI